MLQSILLDLDLLWVRPRAPGVQ